MKTAIKAMMLGVAACAFAAPAFAYTLTGTIPAGIRGVPPVAVSIQLQQPPSSVSYLKLTLSSPPVYPSVKGRVPYVVGFCVGPASDSCISNGGFLVVPGQQTIMFVSSYIFPGDVIWIEANEPFAVPYSLDVDYIP